MNFHPHPVTLEPSVLNVWLMVGNELIGHRFVKCIPLQRPNHHIGRDQSLLILTACVWNEERPSLLFLSHSKKYIPYGPSLRLNNFFFHEKSRLGSHPTLGASEYFNEKKTMRKPERQKSPRNSMTRGMPKSQERVITKIKWVCLRKAGKKRNGWIKEEQQKKRRMTQRVELLIVILSLWNPETLFEPYESFSFIAKKKTIAYITYL